MEIIKGSVKGSDKAMKNLRILFLLLFIFQAANAQTDKEIADVLRERVAVGKTNQSIVVGVIDEKGTRFTSYGKTDKTTAAKNSDENIVFEIGSVTKALTGTLLAEAVRRDSRAFASMPKRRTNFIPKPSMPN